MRVEKDNKTESEWVKREEERSAEGREKKKMDRERKVEEMGRE